MVSPITIFTIGFAKKNAREFFTTLQEAGVKKVVDIRLNNTSQLAGFAKKDDLEFFLGAIGGISYKHVADLAPSQELLDAYKKMEIDWAEYERRFAAIMDERRPEELLARDQTDGACLLCSEPEPAKCHRRLVAERLQKAWPDVEVRHL
ncbi:MAG: DUF488 family protein [Phycisphaerae bacterium]